MEPKDEITQEPSPAGSEPVETPPAAEGANEDEPTTPAPEPTVPLATLLEERERRKAAEEKAKQLESSSEPLEPEYENEEISSIKAEVRQLREERELEKVIAQHPKLVDKLDEFEEFRASKANMTLGDAAKLFLVESGLLASQPKRKGLEKQTGGDRTPAPSGVSANEVKELREGNWKQYEKQVIQNPNLDPESLK